jgi:hypothetical protein
MNRFTLRNAVVTAAAISATSMLHAQPTTMDGQTQASFFIRLWSDTCVKHFTNPPSLRAAAAAFRFKENPDYSSSLLAGEKGTVWDVSLGQAIQQSVVLLDSGTCKTLVRRAAIEPVIAGFENSLRGIKTPGVEVLRDVDRVVQQGDIELRQIAYFVAREGAAQGWSFVATVTGSEAATHQAAISIFRSERPK